MQSKSPSQATVALIMLSLLASIGSEASPSGGAADGGRSGCFNPNTRLLQNVDPGRADDVLRKDLQGKVLGFETPSSVSHTFVESAKKSVLDLGDDLPKKILSNWKQSGCAGGTVRFDRSDIPILEATEDKLVLEGGWVFRRSGENGVLVERQFLYSHPFHCGLLRSVKESHEVKISLVIDLDMPPSLSRNFLIAETPPSDTELALDRKAACGKSASESTR